MTITKLVLLAVASLATFTATGAEAASHHRHRSHIAHRYHRAPVLRDDVNEGAYTRSDDRAYGGSYYGFFTSPSYGRFQSY